MARELFCGGELESFIPVSGTPETGGGYDTSFSVCAIALHGRTYSGAFLSIDGTPTTAATGSTVWLHGYFGANSNYENVYATLVDAASRPIIRVASHVFPATGLQLQKNTSTTTTPTWTNVATYTGVTTGYFDVSLNTANGDIALYYNGTIVGTGTVANVGSGIASVTLGPSASPAAGSGVSQVLVTEDISTVGARVWTRKANGAGALQEMTGGYSSLVKTSINDTTSVTSTLADQTALYEYENVTTPTGMAIGEVWQWTRAKNDGSAPENLKAVCRVGSTNYEKSANMPNMSGGYGTLPARWPVNPATSAKWTESAFNGAQLGMKSAT